MHTHEVMLLVQQYWNGTFNSFEVGAIAALTATYISQHIWRHGL